MNRSNIGNIVTNGMQILSVSATTGAKFLAKADSALNNMSKDSQKAYYQSQAEKLERDTETYNSLSEEEKQAYHNKKYGIKEKTEDFEKTVDDIMSGLNSEQKENISQKISNDISYIDSWEKERENALSKFSKDEWDIFFKKGGELSDKELNKYLGNGGKV